MQAIGMHIGSSFAQVGVWDSDQPKSSSPKARAFFYLPRQNLKSALPKFLSSLPDTSFDSAFITTRFLERLFEFRLGGSTAQLVTAGFESWPFLAAAPVRTGWVQPQRSLPIASQELSLPIAERTDVDGTISVPLAPETLAQATERFRQQNIKRVCVHFLHASKNPANQDAAAHWLREQGFDVFVPTQGHFSENARWRRNTLEASFAGTFDELRTDIEQGLKNFVPTEQIRFYDGDEFRAGHEVSRVKTLFADDELLNRDRKGWLLDLGIEGWRLFRSGQREIWQSPWGPVAVERPWRRELRWQPTSALEKNEDGTFSPPRKAEGFEPGPLSFGRGQKLQVFDLFHSSLIQHAGLREQMPESALSRRDAAFSAMARDVRARDGATLQAQLCEQIVRDVATEVKTWTRNEPVALSGVFGEGLRNKISGMLPLTKEAVPLPAERVFGALGEKR